MQIPEPTTEHRWLQRLLGRWHMEGECPAGPDQAAVRMEATERVRGLGDLWVVAEGEGRTPDGRPALSQMTLGHDPAQCCFVGTFVASMMTHLWVYRGTLDAAGTTLTLDTEGPDFSAEGRTARYQDIIALSGAGERTLASRMLGPDGVWREVMSARYRRIG